jgi:hypothetical protein
MMPNMPNIKNNMVERPQWYVKRLQNTQLVAAYQSLGVELQTETDAPFRMVGVALYLFNEANQPIGAAGNVNAKVRFTRPDGSWIQKHLISGQALNVYDGGAVGGAAGQRPPFYAYFAPLGTNVLYPAGASIQIDLQVAAGVVYAQALVIFIGTKIFPAGVIWAPSYPAKYTARPYFGYNLQILGSALPALNVPFQVAPDADFAWQHGQQTDSCPMP